jgi:hypothetical protein
MKAIIRIIKHEPHTVNEHEYCRNLEIFDESGDQGRYVRFIAYLYSSGYIRIFSEKDFYKVNYHDDEHDDVNRRDINDELFELLKPYFKEVTEDRTEVEIENPQIEKLITESNIWESQEIYEKKLGLNLV